MRRQMIFLCAKHHFVTVARGGELSCEGTPGHRVPDCSTCDEAVREAFAYIADESEVEV